MKTARLVIVGASETANMAYEYFTHDSPFEVVGFAVESAYRREDRFRGLPVVAFEDMERVFDPAEHHAFVAVAVGQLNRLRARLYGETKRKGYPIATYVSSRAFVWHSVEIGENCLVMEQNVLQHGVRIGDNVVLWSGNHVGHQSWLGRHTFVTSHVVISGNCRVGEYCYLGVGSCISNNLTIADDCVIGIGAVITVNTQPGQVFAAARARVSPASSARVFGLASRSTPAR